MLSSIMSNLDPNPDLNTLTAVVLASAAKLVGLSMVALKHKEKFQKVGTVANLYLYPVKSCGVLETNEANVLTTGLEDGGIQDRQWAILDPNNSIITMKEAPRLTHIRCRAGLANIRLSAPDMPDLELPTSPDTSGGKKHALKFIDQKIPVVECGQEAEDWISCYLGMKARLVFSSPDLGTRDAYTRRRKWDNQAKSGDVTIFSYLTSYMMTTTASLEHINSQLDTPVSVVNFRPNIVIDTKEPFDEDNWREMRIGETVLFHTVEPCRRCVITTIDPDNAKKSSDIQPLKLLRSFRCIPPYGSSPLFGVYFASDVSGRIKVGDDVYVLK